MADANLGRAITNTFPAGSGQVRLYERGMTIDRGGLAQVVVRFDFPSIGNPVIATGTAQSATAFGKEAFSYQSGGWNEAELYATITQACAARLALRATGNPGATAVQLRFGAAERVKPASAGVQAVYGLPTTAALQERVLYDVAVLNDAGGWDAIAPHVLYFRASWSDFGIAHITDLHISRRIDFFRQRLRELGHQNDARDMYNWNDRVRGFIKYANYLHSIKALDLILATGDIVDYLFEDDDATTNPGGNALFARQILLGEAGGPDFQGAEELRVPIFITAGNHDYRKYSYRLTWKLDVSGPVNSGAFDQYSGFNISRQAAIHMSGGLKLISDEAAARQAVYDINLPTFREHLARKTSYIVQLGPHRIAMLDSRWDTGIPNSLTDLIDPNEDVQAFVNHTPNSIGPDERALGLAVDALAQTPAGGLFILGIHAPLLNPKKSEYPAFFRETQRAANEDHILGFLRRRGGLGSGSIGAAHPTWFRKSGDSNPQRFVKRVDNADLLDFGVSRSGAPLLLRHLAGLGSRRPATLVLQGHIHFLNEFRLGRSGDELVIYTDYYTHNPQAYYTTTTASESYVEIQPGAPERIVPMPMSYRAMFPSAVVVPPYGNPLSTAPDARAWWNEHQPLVLQSAPLGPMDSNQVSFNGFRLIAVKNNVIDKIHFVSIHRLHERNYVMDLAEAIRVDQPRHHRRLPRSRLVGAPDAVGAPVAFVASSGLHDIVYRATDKHLWEVYREAGGRTDKGDITFATTGAGEAAGNPFFYVTPSGEQVIVYRGTDKHIHSLTWTGTNEPVHRSLTGLAAGAPTAGGDPVGYFKPSSGEHHVIYRRDDGHLVAVWWRGQDRPQHGLITLTRTVRTIPAAGTPSGFADPRTGNHVVCYRGTDGRIRSAEWNVGDPFFGDLSGYARTPQAVGDPFAFYTAHDDAKQIVYRGNDNHIYELYWNGNAPVAGWSLTAAARAPLAGGDPFSYYDPRSKMKYVYYREKDEGQIIELRWTPGTSTPVHANLSLGAFAPPGFGTDRPAAFASSYARHVVYRASDNQICEIQDPLALSVVIGRPRVMEPVG